MKAPYTIFGKTKDIPVVTYTNGKLDTPPKSTWDREKWIEREEEWYGLPNKGTVRVVERQAWLRVPDPPDTAEQIAEREAYVKKRSREEYERLKLEFGE
jgi:hypothetical protein